MRNAAGRPSNEDLRVGPPHGPQRTDPFTFWFDGQAVTAYPGETVATALLAAGQRTLRTTRVEGQDRGMFCGIGACYDCLVVVEGGRPQRGCLTPARPDLEVLPGTDLTP